jgi:hypothetical protein
MKHGHALTQVVGNGVLPAPAYVSDKPPPILSDETWV